MLLKVQHSHPTLVPRYPLPTSLAITSGSPSRGPNRAPTRYNPSCYHHIFDTHVPGLRTPSSRGSRIGCVTIYCAIVLCLFRTCASTSSKPASCISSSKGVIPYAVLTPPCFSSCNILSHPIMEPPQSPDHDGVHNPRLWPKENDRMYHRL